MYILACLRDIVELRVEIVGIRRDDHRAMIIIMSYLNNRVLNLSRLSVGYRRLLSRVRLLVALSSAALELVDE